jgi:hypothetical protein
MRDSESPISEALSPFPESTWNEEKESLSFGASPRSRRGLLKGRTMKRLSLAKETLFSLGIGAQEVVAAAAPKKDTKNWGDCFSEVRTCQHSACPAHPCTVPAGSLIAI